MNEKLSFQNITEALAQRAGVQKKVSETFTKAFFDTIVEALYMGEDTIKVKGLGTFKLVEVGSRESVNVSNGERIIIPGYKKVSFTPEDSVVEYLNQNSVNEELPETTETEPVETIEESNTTSPSIEIEIEKEEIEVTLEQPEPEETTDATINIDDILQATEPERVETPQDEFAGIDMLISTPESIDEVRQQLADATAKMDEAVEVARKAVEDKLRLQKLLERLEANAVPESAEADSIPEEKEEETDAPSATDTPSEAPLSPTPQPSPEDAEAEKKEQAFERIMQDPKEDETVNTPTKKKKTGIAWFISIAVILLAAIIFFLYRTFISIDAVKDITPSHETTTPKAEQPKAKPATQPTKKSNGKESSEATKDTTNAPAPTAAAPQPVSPTPAEVTPARPSTYIIQKGESLTRISQRFYGTKDSVQAIIRINDFADPNNVPIGAKIKLP